MKFRLYTENGALNSKAIFEAFSHGLQKLGHQVVDKNEDIPVIWSVLWKGRMLKNKNIFYHSRKNNIPVIIIEVGNLIRNKTWRICLNHVNRLGEFGNNTNIDIDRKNKLGLKLFPYNENRRKEILIAAQHRESLQWENMPSTEDWLEQTVRKIRLYTDRNVVIRPHPRAPISRIPQGTILETPKKISSTYDNFDLSYSYHAIVNHNSGPAVQAIIHGCPIICDSSSLAYEVSNVIENLENLHLPDRNDWFDKLCHTEWTVEELYQGTPQSRIIEILMSKYLD